MTPGRGGRVSRATDTAMRGEDPAGPPPAADGQRVLRLALLGDGESPHLLKWARALTQQPGMELWAASSRGFLPGFEPLLDPARRLALGSRPAAGGGNAAVLRHLPRLARWLRQVQPDWVHAHYLTSHGTLAWLARDLLGAPGRLVGSAWGSDILVTPERGWLWRRLTRQVLRRCTLTTSDSRVMAERMRGLGAAEVMVFPFGLESMPPPPHAKDPDLCFANRGLEALYAPSRVLEVFSAIVAARPEARLVVANDGSLRAAMQSQAESMGLAPRVRFVGRLDADAQAAWYQRATWYLSLPSSDSVAVSVLEAMAHGMLPLLSDLPANRELVRDGVNGLLVGAHQRPDPQALHALARRAPAIGEENRAWVASQALFGPAVQRFVGRLRDLSLA
jgi:glycosyltransferase involved in cell wall biosynthesis